MAQFTPGVKGTGFAPGRNSVSATGGGTDALGFGEYQTDPSTGYLRSVTLSDSGVDVNSDSQLNSPNRVTGDDEQAQKAEATQQDVLNARMQDPSGSGLNFMRNVQPLPQAPSIGSQALGAGTSIAAGEALKPLFKSAGSKVGGFADGVMNPPNFSTGANVGKPIAAANQPGNLAAETAPGSGGEGSFPGGVTDEGAVPAGAGADASAGMSATELGSGAGEGAELAADAGGAAEGAAAGDGLMELASEIPWEEVAAASACFITEAVTSSSGQGDNAEELQVLRGFRDNVMMQNPVGQALVKEYYDIAPIVVDNISQRPDGLQVFQSMKAQFIDPAVQAVKAGDNECALKIYAQMLSYATQFMVPDGGEAGDDYGDGSGEGADSAHPDGAYLGGMADDVADQPGAAAMAVGAGGAPASGGTMPSSSPTAPSAQVGAGGPYSPSQPPSALPGGMRPPMTGGTMPNTAGATPAPALAAPQGMTPPGPQRPPVPGQRPAIGNIFARKAA